MRLTFPHIGHLWVAIKGMAHKLDVDLVVPPLTSQRTLALGIKYSPQTACLPFKLTLGNMIEGLELGADTVLMLGLCGPCRFGYYHKVQEQILRQLGYDFQMVKQSLGIRQMVKHLTNGASLRKVISSFRFGLAKLKALDELQPLLSKTRAIERNRNSATQVYRDFSKAVDDASNHQAINRAKQEHLQKLLNLPTLSVADPLKIGVTGEFFVVIDSFTTMGIEIELGKLGVEVKRPHSLSGLINFNLFAIVFSLREQAKSHRAAQPYVRHHLGGDGWQSVGEKVLHVKDWDGIVHLEPFGCLPEIMARNIMPATKEKLPVLNLIFDEHTTKTGVITRLEAFIEMIKRKKRVKACA